jgi:hypothetical protein
MKVDPDVLSIHPSSKELVVETPSVQQHIGIFTGSEGPAISSHQLWRGSEAVGRAAKIAYAVPKGVDGTVSLIVHEAGRSLSP